MNNIRPLIILKIKFKMKHNIENYPEYDLFTYSMFYSYICNQLKNGDTFVEIGSWLGKSAIYTGNKIKQRNLKVNFYTIDLFDISIMKEEPYLRTLDVVKENKVYETFLENIEPLKEYITSIKGDSKEVYKQFKDESIDYLFIDGDHNHEGFSQDIKLWYPKVKFGGIFSGHDYIWGGKGVKTIIDIFSEFKAKPFAPMWGDVWFYTK